MSVLPTIFAALVGISCYVLLILLLPKRITSDATNFTRKQLKDLEQYDIATAYQMENDMMHDRYQSTGPLAKIYYSLPLGKYSHSYLVRGGIAGSVDKIFLTCVGIFIASMFLISHFRLTENQAVIILASIAAAYLGAFWIIRRSIKKRMNDFFNQFPDALDIIVRSVKSGFPLNAAVNMVAESMTAPIKDEFRQMSNEVVHGSTLVDALDRMGKRMESYDIRFFVVVLTLQQEVGGNLAEVLGNLSALIRKRKMMKKKVHAITAEGRLTGWILGALPLLVALAINFMEPNYLMPLFNTPSGHMALGATVITIGIGMIIIRKMVDLEI